MYVRLEGARGARGQAAHLRAAALLRGVAARARVHRGARHHREDLRHLPGRLPDERRAGDGGRLRGDDRRRARSATCAGCSTAASGSRATACTCTCSTLPTSSATRARSRWPATIARSSSRGSQMKKAGNALMTSIGGREVHPINVRVGGFYRAPTPRRAARARSTRSSGRARPRWRPSGWAATLPFPDVELEPEHVALARPGRAIRSTAGGSSPTAGSTSRPAEFDEHIVEEHVEHSNALHARLRERGSYLTGPLARYSLASAALRPLARRGGARGRARRRPAATRFRASSSARSSSSQAMRRGARADRRLRAARRSGGRGAAARGRSATARPRRRAACSTTATRSTRTARSSTPGSSRPPRRTSARSRRICARSSSAASTSPDEELTAALRAGDPQPRPVHLLRDALPGADGRPWVTLAGPRVLVVGIGNELRGDDGAGLVVARRVRGPKRRAAGIEVRELVRAD